MPDDPSYPEAACAAEYRSASKAATFIFLLASPPTVHRRTQDVIAATSLFDNSREENGDGMIFPNSFRFNPASMKLQNGCFFIQCHLNHNPSQCSKRDSTTSRVSSARIILSHTFSYHSAAVPPSVVY